MAYFRRSGESCGTRINSISAEHDNINDNVNNTRDVIAVAATRPRHFEESRSEVRSYNIFLCIYVLQKAICLVLEASFVSFLKREYRKEYCELKS